MTFIPSTRTTAAAGTATKKMFHGVYKASVVNIQDPDRNSRVTLKVPQVLGTATSNWAYPMGNPASPSVGDIVYAMFLGGDINHPVYLESNL